jgi:peroxidase
MSNLGTSSIEQTGFGRQSPVPGPHTYDDYLTLALYDLSRGAYSVRDTSGFDPTSEQLIRLVPSDYGDGLNTPSGATRPSPRSVSNIVVDQPDTVKIANPKRTTDMFWLWGQFIDHDIGLTTHGTEAFNISVPAGDEHFDPNNYGNVEIGFTRSIFDETTGSGSTPREQINEITPHLDCTNVYGSTADRSNWLRAGFDGLLKTGASGMLPVNDGTIPNAGDIGTNYFIAGDVRANENVALLSMHTLLFRNHNWWARKLKSVNSGLSDEQLFQRARLANEAEAQMITYNEFLPTLLGKGAIPAYTGYDSGVNPQIANEFSTVAFRLGHSLISEVLLRLANDGTSTGNLTLRDAFFSPHNYCNNGDIHYILRGFSQQICQKIDCKIVDSLRNFLFGQPGSGGLDLASLNIQRGRDHGIPDYNTLRTGLGLGAKATFAHISSDTAVASALSTAYGGDISLVDPWVGGLCEDNVEGSQLGELFHYIVRDQFIRLRDGDPHYFENVLKPNTIKFIKGVKLSTLLKRNTDIDNIQDNVMQL